MPSVPDKRTTEADAVAELRDGMTIGIGGWASRRKPMSIVREILRSPAKDLTVVSYGGPDIGLLCAAGKVRKAVYGFVSLDTIALEPHFRVARQSGTVEAMELDEGMLMLGLQAAAWRVPFLPTRAGLGSDILTVMPEIRMAAGRSPPYPRSRRRRGGAAIRPSPIAYGYTRCTRPSRSNPHAHSDSLRARGGSRPCRGVRAPRRTTADILASTPPSLLRRTRHVHPGRSRNPAAARSISGRLCRTATVSSPPPSHRTGFTRVPSACRARSQAISPAATAARAASSPPPPLRTRPSLPRRPAAVAPLPR